MEQLRSPLWWCIEPKMLELCRCPNIYGPDCILKANTANTTMMQIILLFSHDFGVKYNLDMFLTGFITVTQKYLTAYTL